MTDASSRWTRGTVLNPRRARWLLVVIHLSFLVTPPIYVIIGYEQPHDVHPAIPILAGLGIALLQLRHSLAAARGLRPRHWVWTLAALIALVYVPMPSFAWDWASTQPTVIASVLMLARGPVRIAAALPLIGTLVAAQQAAIPLGAATTTNVASFLIIYWVAHLAVGTAALYGSVWLVRWVDELYATRVELAESAVVRERLRLSRDLHDVLGHSLSAISLKGDLALRLLRTDVPAAHAEIESLTQLARETLHEARAVTQGEHAVSLRDESEGAVRLLAAAGIDARVDIDVPDLAPRAADVLAWAVREGVTNMLRHSEARSCSITVHRTGERIRLEIVNDGARAPSSKGSGLPGLAERAKALAGSVSAQAGRNGTFTLVVELAEGAT